MQFVRNGPDIPERLLQAHEEGRVVFFCGAGISYPARLPDFRGLVSALYKELGEPPNAIQQAAIKAGQFDTAIGLLEAEIVGGRETVRQKMAKILTPDLSAPNSTATHEALLTLAKSRDGRDRLITTNFDRLFEEVIAVKGLTIKCLQAPLLRVPKNRWGGIVYLHGLLSPAPTASDLDDLVVSSGDFGLAYLTERWAARFVSELFRNYTVCFVGYSINDPVLRYMMDALAADRLLGESPPEMFAFGSYPKGKEEERANEWKAKNVTPILYREHKRHSYLHKTLRTWAETYRDGVRGKERIVVEYEPPAMLRPAEIGVICDALATPYKVNRRTGTRPGETVAVFGAGGGLGIHQIMLSRWAGARVVAVDIAAEKFEACRRAGAVEVVDAARQDVVEALRELTGGRGVDVSVDYVSSSATLEQAVQSLAVKGRMVTLGGAGKVFRVDAMQMLLKELDLLGSRYVTRAEILETLELVARGAVWPMVTDIRPMAEAEALHERIERGAVIGRAALLIRDPASFEPR